MDSVDRNLVVWEGKHQNQEFRVMADGSLFAKDVKDRPERWRFIDKGEFKQKEDQ